MRQFERYIRVEVVRGDPVQRARIRLACTLRVFAAEDVLSEMVQTYRHSGTVALARGFDGGGQTLAGDKPLRQAARRAIGSDPAAETGAFREFEQQRAQHQKIFRLAIQAE